MGFEKYIKDYELERKLKDILIKENFGNYFGELRHPELLIVSPSQSGSSEAREASK